MFSRFLKILLSVLLVVLVSCKKAEIDIEDNTENTTTPEVVEKPEVVETPKEKEKKYEIDVLDEGNVIFYSEEGFYRYGPSIIKNDDGSYDAWFARPGNSGSQWDWISYRHSDDGVNWSEEEIVLYPTPGSKDQCSVCDPGVIYFNDYYYLAYTGTDYYEGKGSYNMAFVARSKYPNGPFEKWNGSGWGGNPEPFIFYDGGKDNWGIGEVSFVILEEDLCIYYTYIDIRDSYIGLYKADLVDNWPANIRDKGATLYRLDHDSVEVVYDENLEGFFAFSIDGRLLEGSRLKMFYSKSGKDFKEVYVTKEFIEDYAHNLGVSKDKNGHINSNDTLLLGYAYGKNWGRWNTKIQQIKISSYEE